MKTVRSRLILSHLLPLLLVLPLLGVTLFYLLQTQSQLTELSAALRVQAEQVAAWTQNQPGIWRDSQQAQVFVVQIANEELASDTQVQITLIQPEGQLLASTDPQTGEMVTEPLDSPETRVFLTQGDGFLRVSAAVASAYVPVVNAEEQVVGLVSLSQELDTVTAGVLRLRTLLLGALGLELLLAIGVAVWMGVRFAGQIGRLETAVSQANPPHSLPTLPVQGPLELQNLALAYNRLAQQLRDSELERQRFLANTVHEVARPLGAMRAAINALQQGAADDEPLRAELLQGMDSQIERLRPLLDNLVGMREQLAGQLTLEIEPTPLSPWLREVALPWRAAAQEKGLDFRLAIEPELPTVAIDPQRLAQAVGNLVSNGVKYSERGGVVTVGGTAVNGEVRLSVSNTGPGIPVTEQGRIFRPFYRSSHGTRFPQGMGLGLSIARELVQAHGGELSLQSRAGDGATFTIHLPRAC